MNREVVIAKIKRQQAEIKEMRAALVEDGGEYPILLDVLKKLCEHSEMLLETLEDKSHIVGPGLDVDPEVDKLKKDVQKVKSGVKKMKKLDEEKGKIVDHLAENPGTTKKDENENEADEKTKDSV